jgi:uncharacterized membrane protein YhaH (DUF805 family)
MTERSWEEVQRQNVEQHRDWVDRAWQSDLQFWMHLVTIEATVLGLTVGLLGARRGAAPLLLVLVWVALLLGIFVGCLLVRDGMDAEKARKRAYFLFEYDVAEIQKRVRSGDLQVPSQEYQGLMTAALVQFTPEWERTKQFTQKARDTAKEWRDKLLAANLIKEQRTPVIGAWVQRHYRLVEDAFYMISVAALVLMIAVVLAPQTNSSHDDLREATGQAILAPSGDVPPRPASLDSARASRARSGGQE